MKWAFSLIGVFLLMILFTSTTHAIIFLPALILIPIAKIIAFIIGGFSIPALGLGAIWSKLFGKSLKRTVFVVIVILFLLALVLAIFFKLHNPDRPLF